MRCFLSLVAVALLPSPIAAQGCTISWPDPEIPIPAEVQAFVVDECRAFDPALDASRHACIRAEEFGYRAVVMMLTDEMSGEIAAERYRACRSGLGAEGGRFHRRRAECMGMTIGRLWRFEFSRRASIDRPAIDFATLVPGRTPPER
ncbi:MAG: hypothetical protein ACT4OK_20615 [Gemmobacter sp.]